MSITTNIKDLERRLLDIKDGTTFTPKDYKKVGAGIMRLINMQFRESKDPYGNKWAPIKHRKGQPLRDTGTLLNSIHYSVDSRGLRIGTNLEYAQPHNMGTRHIKQRMFIPTDNNKLPETYNNVIIKVINDRLNAALK